MRLFVVNVGVNAKHKKDQKLRSPVFQDGSFEFIPIVEKSKFKNSPRIPAYCDLKSWADGTRTLKTFIPEEFRNYKVHADPDFENFTYGDGYNPRAANLKSVRRGDQLWFLARLWGHDGDHWTNENGQYFVSYWVVDQNIEIPKDTGPDQILRGIRKRIKRNAHYLRLLAGKREAFRVITGDPRESFRFRKALRVTPEIAGHVYGGKYNPVNGRYEEGGEILRNKNGKPRRFESFPFVTRSIQAHLDSRIPAESKHINALLRLSRKCL